jgi:hypothetical protein
MDFIPADVPDDSSKLQLIEHTRTRFPAITGLTFFCWISTSLASMLSAASKAWMREQMGATHVPATAVRGHKRKFSDRLSLSFNPGRKAPIGFL